MRHLRILTAVFSVAGFVAAHGYVAAAAPKTEMAAYVREPMPPDFQVVNTELEGPVFADASGRTLYQWPKETLRGAYAGEEEGKPGCYDIHYYETAGYFGPYPGG